MEKRQFSKNTRVIAIDFDGVLCEDKYPYIGFPNYEAIHLAERLQKYENACLVLWTCRTDEKLEQAIEACDVWGLHFDYINENPPFRIEMFGGSDPRKVGADEYWDDRMFASWHDRTYYKVFHDLRDAIEQVAGKARYLANRPDIEQPEVRGLIQSIVEICDQFKIGGRHDGR